MLGFMRMLGRVVQYKSFCLDYRSLALFRIALGLLLLMEIKGRLKNIETHYTDAGVLPRHSLKLILFDNHNRVYPNWTQLSFHRISGTVRGQQLWFLVHTVFTVAFIGGFHTRFATFGSWLMLLSLQHRNPLVLQGDDLIRRAMLFWSMFLPLGARFSLDAVRNRSKNSLSEGANSWGTVGYILQIALIYWINGLAKNDPVWRTEGTAVYYALRLDHLVRPFGKVLLRYPALLKKLTFMTLWFELLAPCLLFVSPFMNRIRLFLFSAFAFFHISLGKSLVLGLFVKTCIVSWIPFLPSTLWDQLSVFRWDNNRPVTKGASIQPQGIGGIGISRVREQILSQALSKVSRNIAILSLITIVLSNLRWLFRERLSNVRLLLFDQICVLLGLNQYWSMFAPRPHRNDGWFVIQGILEDGSEIDLLRADRPLQWEKPAHLSSSYGDTQWRNFYSRLALTRYGHLRVYYAHYLQRRWNSAHSTDKQLRSVKVYFMVEEVLPDYQPSKTVKVLLWDHSRLSPRPPTNVGSDLPASFLEHQLENGEFPEEAWERLNSGYYGWNR